MVFYILFFNYPLLEKNMTKYIPFAFSGDGNYNFNGYIIVSILFATQFYAINKALDLNKS